MKKAFLIFFISLLGGALFLQAQPITLERKPNTSTHQGGNKGPILPWVIDLTSNTITMSATPCDYTLCLYDEDGEVAYTVFVPAGTTQVILPTTLSGDFELRFETDTYYYYGYISL